MSNQLEKIKELIDRRTAARMGGGEKAIALVLLAVLCGVVLLVSSICNYSFSTGRFAALSGDATNILSIQTLSTLSLMTGAT